MADMGLFKERLKIALNNKGWKQVDLCKATGISKDAISRYLSGQNVPRQTGLYIIATSLNVSPAWLMGFDVPMDKEIEDLNSIIRKRIINLNKEQLKKVIEVLDAVFSNDENYNKENKKSE